ncbi:hypothetical protein PIB30_075806, partial [Stylosanthes scabra]|nr:hypothetical protein [Stylosanthes scabra]
MDSNVQLNEEMEMDMEMDSGSEGEKSRASNCVSGSLEGEKPLCQAEDSAATECGVPSLQVGFEVTETITISEEVKGANGENGSLSASLKGEGSPTRNSVVDARSILGAKRARIAADEHQPSVHFVYNSLTRASRQKLEELLQHWSEWHAKHASSSNDPSEVLESGEETFFPALHVGLEKTSAVVSLSLFVTTLLTVVSDGSSNLDGGLEIVDDAARCFNCGSYSHSLRDCTRPRNSAAVNIARKQHKSRRNQNANSRNPTRYYQDSPTGKYAGLRPGALDDVTRQLLGLGELDPPPWLNRMRELGYPPGYL